MRERWAQHAGCELARKRLLKNVRRLCEPILIASDAHCCWDPEKWLGVWGRNISIRKEKEINCLKLARLYHFSNRANKQLALLP